MEAQSAEPSSSPEDKTVDAHLSVSTNHLSSVSVSGGSSSATAILKPPQASTEAQGGSHTGGGARSSLARFTSGLGFNFPSATPVPNGDAAAHLTSGQTGVFQSFTKGLVGSSRSAVRAVQVKAQHIVSQNKRRYQEGGFDLDLTYITNNIIAMGFPAGDFSSGIFGYVEGFYTNHIEEVIKFFEMKHQGKYKVYNLCTERLYDASLFQGKASSFPFDDHNCPPIQLILSFCQSASMWLNEDTDNVVVVHCKAGLGRTGLMIASLLLYMKFCPTAAESLDYFNQKRCIDGKGLVHPSQIRYVKYFERILKDYHGNNQPGRRCMLRGFRLYKCPYWIRPSITISDHSDTGILFTTKKHPKTKDLMPEDFWINSPRKGAVFFALPGEPGLAELAGDFKIHFHDRHGDFYCWLNTTMMENNILIDSDDLDDFDKRKLPSPTFQVEILMIDYNGTIPKRSNNEPKVVSDGNSHQSSTTTSNLDGINKKNTSSKLEDKGDVFSDSDGEQGNSSRTKHNTQASTVGTTLVDNHVPNLIEKTQEMSVSSKEHSQKKSIAHIADGVSKSGSEVETPKLNSSGGTDFKAIAADASVFSFGDDEDYESE